MNVGELPDRLVLGATGVIHDRPFTVRGGLRFASGETTWEEWFIDLEGQPAWLATAQGRLLLTREVELPPSALPPVSSLKPGATLDLPTVGVLTIEEVGEGRLLSFEGKLPFDPAVGTVHRYVDASGSGAVFATLDYGAEGDEPCLFAGQIVSPADLRVRSDASATGAAPLECPGCKTSIRLRRADSKSVVCESCHRLLDVAEGRLTVAGTVPWQTEPLIPLGSRGTLRGEALEAIGWLRRQTKIEGETYYWEETLLHGPAGHRWLSVYAGHWLLLSPEPAGAVTRPFGDRAVRGERVFKHFQTCAAYTAELRGEFNWEARRESIETTDYVSPPYLLSVEGTGSELAWTHGEYIPGDEVWKGLGLRGKAPPAIGIGSAQPNPHLRRAGRGWAIAAVALIAIAIIAAVHPTRDTFSGPVVDVPLTPGQVTLSEPFEISGGPQAIRVHGLAEVSDAWVGLDVALIEDATGESESVGVEIGYWSGYDSDGFWSEGSTSGAALIGRVHDGTYVLRVEPVVEAVGGSRLPGAARVWLERRARPLSPILAAILLVLALPIYWALRSYYLERGRWAESDHPWGES